MKSYTGLKQDLLADSQVKQAYELLAPEYRLARSLLKARLASNMTQSELANKAGISQVMIARLESGTANPTIGTVGKVADVLGKTLKLVSDR